MYKEICENCSENLSLLPDESGKNLACTNCGQKYKIESYFLDFKCFDIPYTKECYIAIMIYDK